MLCINCLNTQQIFPVPPGNPDQEVPVTRAQIFGTALLPGRNPDDVFNLRLTNLRHKAGIAVREMGLVPA